MVLFRGYTPDEQRIYAYVILRLDNLVKLKNEVFSKSQSFKMEDYGQVVVSGYGDPTPETMQRMSDEYGFDHASGVIVDNKPLPEATD